jgi:hypothetical protein
VTETQPLWTARPGKREREEIPSDHEDGGSGDNEEDQPRKVRAARRQKQAKEANLPVGKVLHSQRLRSARSRKLYAKILAQFRQEQSLSASVTPVQLDHALTLSLDTACLRETRGESWRLCFTR